MRSRPSLRQLLPWAGILGLAAVGLGGVRAAEPVYPAGSRFGFQPPSDMALSRRFSGFERKEGGATVSVVELPPNAFPELVASFTDANLLSQGFAVSRRESVKLGEAQGLLLSGEQPPEAGAAGPAVRKWLLIVGDATVTGLIIAQALPDAETEATMRGLVTGVTIRPPLSLSQQVDALPFRVTDTAGFRAVRVLAGNSVLMTEGPKDQVVNLEQPILVLAQAVQQPPAPEQRDGFAKTALYSNQTLKDFAIERSGSYRQKGVDWHEIVARAVDVPSNLPVVIAQTIRFNADGYLRAVGIVRQEQREATLSKFREVVDSVQVK